MEREGTGKGKIMGKRGVREGKGAGKGVDSGKGKWKDKGEGMEGGGQRGVCVGLGKGGDGEVKYDLWRRLFSRCIIITYW